jgi:hypothetical protein
MRPIEIEAWTLSIVDRVRLGAPVEDARVELKRDWPNDRNKAARRIAGQANAAHGSPVLWIIGVDEQSGVVGASKQDPATWWPQVQGQFEGITPDLTDLIVPVDSQTVVALLFETARAPFVIRNALFGAAGQVISFEVPWREGTRVRSARREDLVRLLAPAVTLPSIEVLFGSLMVLRSDNEDEDPYWHLDLETYLVPSGEQRIVFPFHQCGVAVSLPDLALYERLHELKLRPQGGPNTPTMRQTDHELIVSGPGRVDLVAMTQATYWEALAPDEILVTAELRPAAVESPAVIATKLRAVKAEGETVLASFELVPNA